MNLPRPDTTAFAVCTVDPAGAAVAACLFEIPQPGTDNLVQIQMLPDGEFRPRDGRKVDTPSGAWRIDAAIAARVIADVAALRTPLVIDYEHQTLQAEDNGMPAPAAGFIRGLEWREGSGLWATVELTQRALQYVREGEYRYFSPVFLFDKRTGAITRLLMGAITNNPALDGMAPMELRAAARFALHEDSPEELQMKNELLLALCAFLAIDPKDREEKDVQADALAALKARTEDGDPLAEVRTALELDEDVGAEEIVAACTGLKAKAAKTGDGKPDPKKYVEVTVVDELRDQIATLTASHTGREIDELVKPALEDGRLLPAQEKWARELGGKDIASLKAYLDGAKPIAALRGSQTGGRQPEVDDENGLSADELAVCKATGVDPAQFAKHKKAVAA